VQGAAVGAVGDLLLAAEPGQESLSNTNSPTAATAPAGSS
jgi:hypothetical protein